MCKQTGRGGRNWRHLWRRFVNCTQSQEVGSWRQRWRNTPPGMIRQRFVVLYSGRRQQTITRSTADKIHRRLCDGIPTRVGRIGAADREKKLWHNCKSSIIGSLCESLNLSKTQNLMYLFYYESVNPITAKWSERVTRRSLLEFLQLVVKIRQIISANSQSIRNWCFFLNPIRRQKRTDTDIVTNVSALVQHWRMFFPSLLTRKCIIATPDTRLITPALVLLRVLDFRQLLDPNFQLSQVCSATDTGQATFIGDTYNNVVWREYFPSIQIKVKTRMVQLPATAAIEYVAAVNACLMYIVSSV